MEAEIDLETLKPAVEQSLSTGELPPWTIACAGVPPLCFYLDHPEKEQAWETMIAETLLEEVGKLVPLPLTKADAELLFQVLSERTELRSLIVTTNLPFTEWTSVFPDPRLCRAVIDRLTHRAHLIETGTRSVRLEEAQRRRRREVSTT